MKESQKCILAFLFSALVPAISLGLSMPTYGETFNQNIFDILLWTGLLYVPSLLVTIFFGLPIYLLLRLYNFIYWWSALAAGFFVGALLPSIFRLPDFYISLREAMALGGIGSLAAFVFYSVKNLVGKIK